MVVASRRIEDGVLDAAEVVPGEGNFAPAGSAACAGRLRWVVPVGHGTQLAIGMSITAKQTIPHNQGPRNRGQATAKPL